MTTPTANPGFAPAPVNSTQWNAQVIEANAQAQQAAISYKAQDPQSDSSLVPDWLMKPVEWIGSKIQSVYSNVISRPISTVLLAGLESAAATGNAKPTFGVNTQAFSNFFSANTWDQAYQDAKNVSPGQALTFAFSNFAQGSTNADLLKNMQKPVMYQMKDPTGRPLVDQNGNPVTTNLNATGLLWQNPAAVQQYYSSGAQKWISGGLDAGMSWYLDPLALAGKGVGAARDIAYVRPAAETAGKTFIGQARQAAFGGLFNQPFAGSAAAAVPVSNISKNLTSSAFTAMGDLIMDQKAKLAAVQGPIPLGGKALPGSTFEDWASRQSWTKNSPQGGALAAQLGKAMNRDQVNQILAISMGDESAIQKLTAQNADLGAQATMMDRQQKGLVSNFPTNPDPATAALQAQQLSDMTDSINKIAQQSSEIDDKLNLANALQKGMYFNPTLSPALSAAGQFGRNTVLAKFADRSIGATLLYNNLYVRPVRAFTGATWGGIRAPGHIDITADDSYKGLDAGLDQAKVWSPAERQQIVSRYIASDISDRGRMLDITDRATVGRIAAKYGLTDDQASALYSQIGGMKGAAKDGRVYSTAMIDTPSGGQIRADHVDDAGNLITVSPILSTQLQNTHILTDFEHFDSVLKYNGGAFKRLFAEQELRDRAAAGGPLSAQAMQQAQSTALQGVGGTLAGRAYKGVQVGKDMADLMGRLWKFNALLRLGYGPRAIADDFLGQVARHGAYNFFVDRAMDGGKNYFMRKWNSILNDPTGFETMKASLDSGIEDLTQQSAKHQAKIDQINSYLPPAMDYTGKGAKGRAQFNARTTNLKQYQARLDDTQRSLEDLKAQRDQLLKTKLALGDRYTIMPDGTAFPRPFEGPQGALFKDLNTGRRTIDSVMGGSATDLWNSFRSNDWQVLTSTAKTEQQHLAAWLKDVQFQIANDPAAMKAVQGMNADQLSKWFGTLQGRQYRSELGLKNMSDADHADRIVAHVDQYLPTHTPQAMELRQAVANGADDQTVKNLMSQVDMRDRPAVQSEGLAYAMGKSNVIQHMDKMMSGFYEKMNGMPVEALSRNPLFFQLYRQHVSELWQGARDQGIDKLSVQTQQRMTEQARKLALKDVKKFTFNMDYESKLAHQLRFVSPFFGPMQEAFTRWGRIVADKPEIIARNADIYTAPARSGMEVDQNGNPIGKDGYVTNPDGSKTLVAKNNIHIQFQVPTWAQKGLGLDGGTMIDMPLNTLSMVMRNDPWFNPGVGPFMQVPADYVAMKSDPKVGDLLQKMGILQQVTADPMANVGGALPKFLSTIISGGDPAQQQKDMLQIMQAEDYKYKNGMRDTEPTWSEVKAKAAHGAMWRALVKTVLPVSASFTDPYQFFRDRYTELQKADPNTADQIFLAKYGDAAFAFTGALSKSSTGLPSTAEAVMAEKKYQDIIDKDPSLAALIVGPNAAGNYSGTAYQQQLASGERTKLTAQQSMDAAQTNLGWAQYSKYMNQITSGLYQAGFTSFTQKGAEMYANQRKGIIAMLTSPTLPDGKTANPYYNAQFDQAFNTTDKSKEDRQAAAMQQIVEEGSLINDPMRADIQGLSQYMVWRASAKQVLGNRAKQGGSADINAKSNADILQSFHDATMQLIESNTAFQSLHDRFLSKDMFDHYSPALGTQTEANP